MDVADRNREIIDRLSAGKTLREVGAEFGITRERVRQIAVNKGFVVRRNLEARRSRRNEAAMQATERSLPWRIYLANKAAVDAAFGEELVILRSTRTHALKYVIYGKETGKLLKFKAPIQPRATGGATKYYGFIVSKNFLYIGMTPDRRFWAVLPSSCDGRFVYLPMGSHEIRHNKEKIYVELTSSV